VRAPTPGDPTAPTSTRGPAAPATVTPRLPIPPSPRAPTRPVPTVELYFDFLSPYAYLALARARAFGERNGIGWELHPVVFARLLDAHGLVGPVEVEAKRRYTWRDVVRSADALGVPLVGPPAHPFRSLDALRVQCLLGDGAEALELAVSLARAAWADGRDLADWGVLADAVRAVGLDADDLERRASAPEVKRALRLRTEAAVKRGVFGVPTFARGDELFWGHDRMDQLALRLAGGLPAADARVERLLSLPRAVERRRPGAG